MQDSIGCQRERPWPYSCIDQPRRTKSRSGAADFIQKLLQEKKLIPFPVVVVDKPGGGGSIGLGYLDTHAGGVDVKAAKAVLFNTVAEASVVAPERTPYRRCPTITPASLY